MRMKRVIMAFSLAVFIFAFANGGDNSNSIIYSKHNLSVSGPGSIKSQTESRICIFCHSSHNTSSEGPLWNHESTSTGSFKSYNRSTLLSRPDQPNGSTKLCLSCHDGTIAVGAIRGLSSPIAMTGVNQEGSIPSNRKSNLGIDLTGTHPVSVKFTQNLALMSKKLVWPAGDRMNSDLLDADGFVQCTTCHDPHSSASEKYPFWKRATFSEVCEACHQY